MENFDDEGILKFEFYSKKLVDGHPGLSLNLDNFLFFLLIIFYEPSFVYQDVLGSADWI